MLWLIDLTATTEATSGLNSWALGVLQGIRALGLPDRWTLLGTSSLPSSLRQAAHSTGANVVISASHRGIAQQFESPGLARRIGADGLLAASTELPLWRRGIPAVSVLYDFRHRDEPERYRALQRRYRNLMYRHAVPARGAPRIDQHRYRAGRAPRGSELRSEDAGRVLWGRPC